MCRLGRSTALFSSARSRMTSRISPWCTCATLVWSTHGLISAFFHVGRQFGTSRPNTLACGLRKRPMGVTTVTPNTSRAIIISSHTHTGSYQSSTQTMINDSIHYLLSMVQYRPHGTIIIIIIGINIIKVFEGL